MFRKICLSALIVGALCFIIIGCASPTEKAQKLFDEGKYEEVLEKYADQPIARQAKEMLAQKLVEEGKYEEVLVKYPDTKAVTEAKNQLAARLLEEEKYQEVVDRYPESPAADQARQVLAQQLYDEGNFDELVRLYPNTQAGRQARTQMAAEAYQKTKKMKKSARIEALQAIVDNDLYAGTEAYDLAQSDLKKLEKPKPIPVYK